jgi:ribosomal protein L3 glutamine methyltransferase
MDDSVLTELHTLKDFVRWGVSHFEEAELYYGHGTDNALSESIALVLSVLRLPRDLPAFLWDSRLTSSEKEKLGNAFSQRIGLRRPLAYIIQEAWFADLKFYVDDRVLIPRSPFGELIQNGFAPWVSEEHEPVTILDMCCGSGCMAIACAHYFPDAQVDAVDIDLGALDVARCNVDRHNLADQVSVIESDLFCNLEGKTYDIILSNPPYVDAIDMASLPKEYTHEPTLALAAGEDGLDLVHRILANAARFLQPDGMLFVEVGNSQYALMDAYPDVPFCWLEFERGGQGVFMLSESDLKQFQGLFEKRAGSH